MRFMHTDGGSMKQLRGSFRVVSLLLLLTLLSCAVSTPARKEPAPEKKTGQALNTGDLERRIHTLINRERTGKGLPALTWNSALSTIARRHSRDMAARNYFSHVSPDGHDFSYRYRLAGYSCSVQSGDVVFQGAENIFQNNLYDRIMVMNGVKRYDWNSLERIAETTVSGWMNSPGHRKNILNPYSRSEGIGIAISDDDKVYITENFC